MRVAVVSENPISDALPGGSGWRDRHVSVLRALAASHDVLICGLTADPGRFTAYEAEMLGLAELDIHVIPAAGPRRRDRLDDCRRTWVGRPVAWQRRLIERLRRWRPDVVVCLDWFPLLCQTTFRQLGETFRTVAFVEENFAVHAELRKSSMSGRALQRLELRAWQRDVSAAASVVVISERERAWAASTFGPGKVHVVPLAIDLAYWAQPRVDNAPKGEIFVIGQLVSDRNSQGLVAVLEALDQQKPGRSDPMTIVAASSSQRPAALDCAGSELEWLGPVADPRPYYRRATATLVPAFLVSGAKTTILQGWATRCPVVTTREAAASVGGVDGVDLLAGATPASVADALRRVVSDSDLRGSLAASGFEKVAAEYSQSVVTTALDALLRV